MIWLLIFLPIGAFVIGVIVGGYCATWFAAFCSAEELVTRSWPSHRGLRFILDASHLPTEAQAWLRDGIERQRRRWENELLEVIYTKPREGDES